MNSKELMIGNLVDFNGEIAKVRQLLELEVVFACGDTELYENLKPIIITEEWLTKMGFRKNHDKLYFLPVSNLVMEIHAVYFRNTWLIELANDRKNIVTEVFNVNQLQNLYSVLTGKKLNINT